MDTFDVCCQYVSGRQRYISPPMLCVNVFVLLSTIVCMVHCNLVWYTIHLRYQMRCTSTNGLAYGCTWIGIVECIQLASIIFTSSPSQRQCTLYVHWVWAWHSRSLFNLVNIESNSCDDAVFALTWLLGMLQK